MRRVRSSVLQSGFRLGFAVGGRGVVRGSAMSLRWALLGAFLVVVFVGALSSSASATPGVMNYVGTEGAPAASLGVGGVFPNPAGAANGVDANDATGDVYVADRGGNRVQRFTALGSFVSAWGFDVVRTGETAAGDVGTNVFEVCTVAAACKSGLSSIAPVNGRGGQFSAPGGIAVNQQNGHVYVSDVPFNRVQEFTAAGAFVRAFGQDVVASGAEQADELQTLTVTATAGQYRLTFGADTTGDLAFDATAGQVEAALNGLASINTGGGSVTVTARAGGAMPYRIAFGGARADTNQAAITAAAGTTPLSGGAATIAPMRDGATGFEVCTDPATCKVGVATAAEGGSLQTIGTLTVAPAGSPNQGNVLVANRGKNRVEEFTSTGAFVRAFGGDVAAAGPDNKNFATGPNQQNEIQSISVRASAGSFRIHFPVSGSVPGVGVTADIAYNASASEVEDALNAITNISTGGGSVNVTGGPGNASGSSPYIVTFDGGPLAGTNVDESGANNLSLAGGSPTTGTTIVTIINGNTGFEVCQAAEFDICQTGVAARAQGQFGTSAVNSIAEDNDGNIYTVESTVNFRVQKFTLPGNTVTPQGTFADAILTGTTNTPAPLRDTPSHIAVDGAGDVYVVKAFPEGTGTPPAEIDSIFINIPNPAPAQQRILRLDPDANGGNGEVVDVISANPGRDTPGFVAANSTSLGVNGAGSRLYTTQSTGGQSGGAGMFILGEIPPSNISTPVMPNVKSATATLTATVAPSPIPLATRYHFEYSRNGVTWLSAPEAEVNLGNGSGSGDPNDCPVGNPPTCNVSVDLSDLALGVTYQVRVVARTPYRGATFTSPVAFFTTEPAAPSVRTQSASWSGGPDSQPTLSLRGRVNPEGAATTYRFEYVTQAQFDASGFAQAASVPVDGASAGHGVSNLSVEQIVAGLDPTAVYHYRLVAANAEDTVVGDDRTVSPPEGGDRFIELVSEGDGQGVGLKSSDSGLRVSDDGLRAAFRAQAFGDQTGSPGIDNPFTAQRGVDGWSVGVSGPGPAGEISELADYSEWSADLTKTLGSAQTDVEKTRGELQWTFSDLAGSVSPAGSRLVPFERAGTPDFYTFLGGSADLSSFVFWGPNSASSSVTLLAGESLIPTGSQFPKSNLYEIVGADTASPSLRIVNRTTGGAQIGGGCGAALGGIATSLFGADEFNGVRGRAVSEDGSVVYFSARAGTPGSSCGTGFPVRVFKRVDGTSTVAVSASQCTRTVSDPGGACNDTAGNGNDAYQSASADGSKVLFLSSRQLVGSATDRGDTDATSDLYLYDSNPPAGQPNLVQVSAGEVVAGDHPTVGSGANVLGLADVSADGSRVYFAATGRLTSEATQGANNLYVYQRDAEHPAGRIDFVATLSPNPSASDTQLGVGIGDGDIWAPKFESIGKQVYALPFYDGLGESRDFGDGRYLVFVSEKALVADDGDSSDDLYRYDDEANALVCLSCVGDDANRVGIPGRNVNFSSGDYVQQHRIASEDVSSVVFATAESLVAADDNTVLDAYEWRDGELELISGATGDIGIVDNGFGSGSYFRTAPRISPDGQSVFFLTRASLLPQDTNFTGLDYYVARAGGGFPLAAGGSECDAAAGGCQGGGADRVVSDRQTSSPSGGDVVGRRTVLSIGGLGVKARRRAVGSGVLALRVRASQPGVVRVSARGRIGKRTRSLGSASRRFAGPGVAVVELRLSRAARRVLGRGGRLVVSVSARSAGARPRSLTVRLDGGAGK